MGMKGGEGYNKFLKDIKKKLFKSRFDRASPEKKKGITFDEAEHLSKVFLLNRNHKEITIRQAEKMAAAEIKRLKKKIKEKKENLLVIQLNDKVVCKHANILIMMKSVII